MAKSFRMLRPVALSAIVLALAGTAAAQSQEARVLVFSKTPGYPHSTIELGLAAVHVWSVRRRLRARFQRAGRAQRRGSPA